LKKNILSYVNEINLKISTISDSAEKEKKCIKEENLIITNGSDEALILICQKFLTSPNKVVLIPLPTYEHFVLNAEATNC